MRSRGREGYDRRHRNYAIRDAAKDKPCVDCGIYLPPFMMDLDHIINKRFNVGRIVNRNVGTLQREIEKCEVVCKLCHAVRTHVINSKVDRRVHVMAKTPFGGVSYSFKGQQVTMENLFGAEDLAPTEVFKVLWAHVKKENLRVKEDK